MFLKSVQTWASAGVGQGAKATMTKPLKPEDYDKSSLKRPKGVKAVIPRAPTKTQSSTPGHIEYAAKPTMKRLKNDYDTNALKRPYTRKTPIPVPYTKENAMKQFMSSKSEAKSDGKEEKTPKLSRMEMLKQIAKTTKDSDLRDRLVDLLNFVQRMDIIMKKRMLTGEEQRRFDAVNYEIDTILENFKPEENEILKDMEDIKQNIVPYADQSAVGARDAASQAEEASQRAQRALQAFQPVIAPIAPAVEVDEEKQRLIKEAENDAYIQLLKDYPDLPNLPINTQKQAIIDAKLEARKIVEANYRREEVEADIADEESKAVARYIKSEPDFYKMDVKDQQRATNMVRIDARNRVLAFYEKEDEKRRREAISESKYDTKEPEEPVKAPVEEVEEEVEEVEEAEQPNSPVSSADYMREEIEELEKLEQGLQPATGTPLKFHVSADKPLTQANKTDMYGEGDEGEEGDEGDEGESKDEQPEASEDVPEQQITPDEIYNDFKMLEKEDKINFITAGASKNDTLFISKVNDILKKYNNLSIESIANQMGGPKKGYIYENIISGKDNKDKIINMVLGYLDKTKIPDVVAKKKDIILEMMSNIPSKKEETQNVGRIIQNAAEVKKIAKLKGGKLTLAEWIKGAASTNQTVAFQLGKNEMYDILDEIPMTVKDKLGTKKKPEENLKEYYTRLFNNYKDFRELVEQGEIRRSKYGLLFKETVESREPTQFSQRSLPISNF